MKSKKQILAAIAAMSVLSSVAGLNTFAANEKTEETAVTVAAEETTEAAEEVTEVAEEVTEAAEEPAAPEVTEDGEKPETCKIWRGVREMLDREYPEAAIVSEWCNPKVALGAGFIPAWAELVTDKITN